MAGTTRKAGGGFTEPDAQSDWVEHHDDTYRYPIYLFERDGRFVATAATVPNVVADGSTEDDALTAVRGVLADLLRARKAGGEGLRRADVQPPPDSASRWVIVRLGG